ncbi:peptidase A24 [Metallosphaera tengchongensis]|uniref:Peptidase A24 n=1 Tax=Metallosphaera tengchongensis TaxID=1532350 RepID=A0A6N0NU52_9CREN|nr:A24 family peptidase C-terminal domain-containing protein [Metallosphaera tengchongensis]QKQ99684.1 peptidase A24 [Metallosphaera tengchongensis]
MLFHTSVLDLKYREVDPKIWLYYSPLSLFIIFNLQSLNLFIYLYSLFAVLAVFFAFYLVGFMGGADLFAIMILSLANAKTSPLFFGHFSKLGMEPLIVVLFSSALIVASGIVNFLTTFKYTAGMGLYSRLILSLTAKRVRMDKFLKSKFLFPLSVIDENGNESVRIGFSVEENDSDWRERYRELVSKGIVSPDRYIWVAWGVPVIPFIFLGYVLSLFVGIPYR